MCDHSIFDYILGSNELLINSKTGFGDYCYCECFKCGLYDEFCGNEYVMCYTCDKILCSTCYGKSYYDVYYTYDCNPNKYIIEKCEEWKANLELYEYLLYLILEDYGLGDVIDNIMKFIK